MKSGRDEQSCYAFGNSIAKADLSRWKRLLSAQIKPKFALPRSVGVKPKRILDVGIANDSYLECKAIYPNIQYHGLDCVDQNVVVEDGDHFFLRDLEDPQALISLPGAYDLIIANHVLEHLARGEKVFSELCDLLAPQGILYAEIPSIRTAYISKHGGRYHFHDDPTHRAFYALERLANIAMRQNCKIISCGPVSTGLKDILSLPRAVISLLTGDDWGPYMLHLQRKIDHIMVRRPIK